MKKFISMVMAAAMVTSLVPATAFAASAQIENSVKVVNAAELTKPGTNADATTTADQPEVQLKVKDTDYEQTKEGTYKLEFNVILDNAEWICTADAEGIVSDIAVELNGVNINRDGKPGDVVVTLEDDDEINVVITSNDKPFKDDDVISIDLNAKLTKKSVGTEATVTIKSDDFTEASDLVFAAIVDKGFTVEMDDVTEVAPEERVTLEEDLEIESVVGTFAELFDIDGTDKMTLKLNKGFEFVKGDEVTFKYGGVDVDDWTGEAAAYDDDEIEFVMSGRDLQADKYTIKGLQIEATTAKPGDVATITVKISGVDSQKVDVAKVVESGLTISVDEDEDVPEMWSGVNSKNDGLTADEDEHVALLVTVEETFKGAYNDKDEIEFVLPEGVYVTAVDFGTVEGASDMDEDKALAAFEDAYQEGDHKSFVFEKRAFTETTVGSNDKEMKIEFELTLVADPGFVGDVALEMLVDGESKGEVTIATFKTPMVIEAAQNDLKIDYRNTEVPTDIVVKEAEAGLWEKGLKLTFGIDDHDVIKFEDDATFTVNEESGMEIDDATGKSDATLTVEIDEESDDEAGVITISDIELFMERNIPAGAYDLTMNYTAANDGVEYPDETLFAPDCDRVACNGETVKGTCEKDYDCIIDDVSDWSDVAKEAWINVVTAGREADDASFTTKVVVPVGESYIIAGEQTVALDVPAYVSAAGYTMLPVRAVATALGINNNNVLWDQATKTVTILYGQRIITMTVGAKAINVNGSVIPASASVEVVDGRTFLPMRDLATALGVTDITWDAATKTATLNGNK